MYSLNIRAPKYMKQILTELKGERDSDIVIVKNFNIPLSRMNRKNIQTEDQNGNRGLEQCYKPNGPDRHV